MLAVRLRAQIIHWALGPGREHEWPEEEQVVIGNSNLKSHK